MTGHSGRYGGGGDSFILVMIRTGRILDLNGLQPGVLAGRLIKVAMYTIRIVPSFLLSVDHDGEWKSFRNVFGRA